MAYNYRRLLDDNRYDDGDDDPTPEPEIECLRCEGRGVVWSRKRGGHRRCPDCDGRGIEWYDLDDL